MITNNEIQSTLISPTAKDFFQIWNDLLEVAGKISERWDPSTTNESDPGIVLLKVLTALADKLNYNIDKNILEAYMPSAAQEESMRKLCDMLGYDMKYYNSATTDVTIYYTGDPHDWQTVNGIAPLILPRFTQITNIDADIVYTTTERAVFTKANSVATVPCIEGTLHFCEEDNDGIVTLDNIDDNCRYYLPQTYIAENGLFIYNVSDGIWSTEWNQVDNLNSHPLKSYIYKFGFDSKKFLPYIQFPSDVSALIGDGLRIGYIVTSGINGNVSARTLNTFTTPIEWKISDNEEQLQTNDYNKTGKDHTAEEFKCYNESAATNGTDREGLNSAYNGFKKTIGTFDTLVTCRDYMNKIYQLTTSNTNTIPLVSNSIVSDIRDDINRAMTICSFDDYGIKYVDYSHSVAGKGKTDYSIKIQAIGTVTAQDINVVLPASIAYLDKTVTALNVYRDVNELSYWRCCGIPDSHDSSITNYSWYNLPDGITDSQMNHFDLMLYPFKTVQGLNNKTEFDGSFKYDDSKYREISAELDNYKTICHKLNLPENDEIICIKNYMKLNAKITTMNKVDTIEWKVILENIKAAIYKAFNLRNLDFSEEIPFDDILNTIQKADVNIKNVALEEPSLYTVVLTKDNSEYFLTYDQDTVGDNIDKQNKEIRKKLTPKEKEVSDISTLIANKKQKAKELYNKLVLRNILAGRVELFNYDTKFSAEVDEAKASNYSLVYPENDSNPIIKLESEFDSQSVLTSNEGSKPYMLEENQIIQFRTKNFRTIVTYPSYVNYYLELNDSHEYTPPTAAVFYPLSTKLKGSSNNWAPYIQLIEDNIDNCTTFDTTETDAVVKFDHFMKLYGVLFEPDGSTYKATTDIVEKYPPETGTKTIVDKTTHQPVGNKTYYIYEFTKLTFPTWTSWCIDNKNLLECPDCDGIYRSDVNNKYLAGELIDNNHTKYILVNALNTQLVQDVLSQYFIAEVRGDNGTSKIISANAEYKLKEGENLYINYTDAQTSVAEMTADSSAATLNTTSTVVNREYSAGTIIKPNFDIEDSAIKSHRTNFSKKTGFTFSNTNVTGMFTIGANEQIEIREPVEVYVYDETNGQNGYNPTYVYFNINNEIANDNGQIIFLENNKTKILEEGEYFWYTDKNKQLLTYCGPGTQIENKTGGTICKLATSTKVTTEDILENGISVVPWITIPGLYMATPNIPSINDKYIKWTEYQYITLTADDQLIAIGTSGAVPDYTFNIKPNKTWASCAYAKYQYKDTATAETLPEILISDDNNAWQVRTKLQINTNATLGQKLNAGDSIILTYADSTTQSVLGEADQNITFKTNYNINSTSDTIETTYTQYNDDEEVEEITDFSVKVYEKQPMYLWAKDSTDPEHLISRELMLNNTQKYYTGFTFDILPENYDSTQAIITLSCAIPDTTNQFGLIMFYYKTDNTFIEYPKLKTNDESILINYYNNADWTAASQLDIKPGINIIKISQTCNLSIYPIVSGQLKDDLIIFSPLDIINKNATTYYSETEEDDEGLNLDILKYNMTDTEILNNTAAKQLLADIKKADEEGIFYYNAILDNSIKLNINEAAGETMQTEKIWYDYNNVNNKFVVSEIDSDYLDTGITLARTSTK